MPDFSGTSLARVLRILIEEAERVGADRAKLFHESGLDEAMLADPDGRIPTRWTTNLWMAIVRTLPDVDTGVRMGASQALRDYGLVGYAMLHSRTLEDAFERLLRYSRIVQELMQLRLVSEKDSLSLTFARRPILEALEQPAEYAASRVVAIARELTGAAIVPLEVRLPHPERPRTAAHRTMFGPQIVYDTPDMAIVFHASDVRRPVVQADHELGVYLGALADRTLTELPERTSFMDAVRRAIWDRTNGTVSSLDEVAGALGSSPRSLQRRLAGERTSFQRLRDEVRRTMAGQLLRGADFSIQEIAYLLGYADSSAFHRAFRRWDGRGPRKFREALRARIGNERASPGPPGSSPGATRNHGRPVSATVGGDHARLSRVVRRVAAVSVILNAALAASHVVIGLWARSTSVVAAGVEFGGDVLAALVVWAGLWIAARPADDDHPYGHGRAEIVSGLILGIVLVFTGGLVAVRSLAEVGVRHEPPAIEAIWPLLAALAVKSVLMVVKFRIGSRANSTSLIADGWNDAVDLLSGAAALTGLGLTLIDPERFLAADHFGGFAIGVIVVSIGIRITREASLDLMDTMPGERFTDRIRRVAMEIEGVLDTEKCRARKTGLQYHIDLHVEVDPSMTVAASHAIAERVRNRIRDRVGEVADVLVHVEPAPGRPGPEPDGGDAPPDSPDRL